jgi:hypothetical protein
MHSQNYKPQFSSSAYVRINNAKWLKARTDRDEAKTVLTNTEEDWTELIQDMAPIMNKPEEPVRHRIMPRLRRMVAPQPDRLPVEKQEMELRKLNHQKTRFKNILKKSKQNAEATRRASTARVSIAMEASVIKNLFNLEVSKTRNMHAKY